MDTKTLDGWRSVLQSDLNNYRSFYDDVSRFVVPGVRDPNNGERGPYDPANVHDSTAMMANWLLSSSFFYAFCSPSSKWFQLRLRNRRKSQSWTAQRHFQETEDDMFAELSWSNFYENAFSVILSWSGFGMGPMLMEDIRTEGKMYTSVYSPYDVVAAENEEGILDTAFFSGKPTVYQLARRWKRQVMANKKLAEMYEKNPFERVDMIHYVGPKDDWNVDRMHQYVSIRYLKDDPEVVINQKENGQYDGYHELPLAIPRFDVLPGERRGVGPGIYALPTVRSLNMTCELKYDALEMVIDPPFLTEDGNLIAVGENKYIEPGAQIVVKKLDKIREWVTSANVAVAEMDIEKQREQIDRLFHTRELTLEPDRPEMTRYEVQRRHELLYKLLNPGSARFNREFIRIMVERSFGVLYRAGKLPQTPQELANEDFDIELTSPMARAQKNNELQAAMDLMQIVMGVADRAPLFMEKVDLDQTINFIAENTGVPLKLIRSTREFKAIEQKQKQAMQQREQLEQMETAAGAAQRIGRSGLVPKAA